MTVVGRKRPNTAGLMEPMGRSHAPQVGSERSPSLRGVTMTTAQVEARRESDALAKLLGRSTAAERLRREVTRVAQVSAPVLIRGETGTGKELVARALHELSPRATNPFVAINCSAVPVALFESHLFGHERGSFTGAEKSTQGYFERAGAGTILLDEVGDLPLELQPKILRVLETKSFVSLGGVHRDDTASAGPRCNARQPRGACRAAAVSRGPVSSAQRVAYLRPVPCRAA